jgi:quercetin dioxygenase-like cupin family protein
MSIKKIGDIPIDPMDGAVNTYIQWLISPLDGEEKIGLRRFIIKSGGYIPPHKHKELYHIQYVIKGEYRVGIEDKEHTVSVGDIIYIPPQTVHWYKNDSGEDIEFLCIIPLDVDSTTEFIETSQ